MADRDHQPIFSGRLI